MEIVLVGRSNIGKSSVIRQLTGKRVKVGKRPGVTRKISRYEFGKLEVVDMPGFGFMSGVPKHMQEATKTNIVRYLEQNREKICAALEVVDAKSFMEIAERWEKRRQVPVDVEMFSFLEELKLEPIVVANKIDLLHPDDRDEALDGICEKLGFSPPWRQWQDIVAPTSAKTGEGVPQLRKLVTERLRKKGLDRLVKWPNAAGGGAL
ncbi:MAG: GTP-binding protein EngB [Candidatus Hadarchaeota archaeon]